MECNKEEAIRARVIAERKLLEKDYLSAKKFVLKAQSLFPKLDGILHLLPSLEVYIASENKINGENDWYGILGVTPFADDEAIRKQYKKMALALHPDKNKSPGADGAFMLISEAWSLLSDKRKKLEYDQRRSAQNHYSSVPTPPPSSDTFWTPPPTNFDDVNFFKTAGSSAKVDTFWTPPATNFNDINFFKMAGSSVKVDPFWTPPTNFNDINFFKTAGSSAKVDTFWTPPATNFDDRNFFKTAGSSAKVDTFWSPPATNFNDINFFKTAGSSAKVDTFWTPPATNFDDINFFKTAGSSAEVDTFWTVCHKCQMHFEYLKLCLNRTLICFNCNEAFHAFETTHQVNLSKPQGSSREHEMASGFERVLKKRRGNENANSGV